MSPRELIILILGLAIVGVVLRGLFVALRARKGQIRLAIDKNIPSDVDLEALEMAELPGGGARVVQRSLDSVNSQNSRLDAALKKAEDIQLGADNSDDKDVPILMDAVSLSKSSQPYQHNEHVDESVLDSPAEDSFIEDDETAANELDELEELDETIDNHQSDSEIDFEEDDLQASPQIGDLVEETLFEEVGDNADEEDEIWENQASREEESADDVLLDYEDYSDDDNEVSDSLASVAPDYRSDAAPDVADEYAEDEMADDELDDDELEPAPAEPIEDRLEEFEDDIDEESGADEYEPEGEEEEEVVSNAPQARSFEDQLDEFSMSAGERIGFTEPKQPAPPPAKPQSVSQPSLFDDEFDSDKPVADQKSKPMSFLSALKRSITPQEKPIPKPVEEISLKTPVVEAKEEVVAAPQVSTPAPEAQAQPIVPQQQSREARQKEAPKPSRAQSEYEAGTASEPSEVIVLNVMARQGYAFAGDDLLQVLITSGLKFGEMNIFHQRIGADKKGPVLFSVANVLNPGTFDLNNMDNFTTLGVSFFLALPTVMNNLEAFEKMLSVAQQVKAGLDGELKDDNRNVMTSQTIEHYRQRVRDFELRRLKAAGVRH